MKLTRYLLSKLGKFSVLLFGVSLLAFLMYQPHQLLAYEFHLPYADYPQLVKMSDIIVIGVMGDYIGSKAGGPRGSFSRQCRVCYFQYLAYDFRVIEILKGEIQDITEFDLRYQYVDTEFPERNTIVNSKPVEGETYVLFLQSGKTALELLKFKLIDDRMYIHISPDYSDATTVFPPIGMASLRHLITNGYTPSGAIEVP